MPSGDLDHAQTNRAAPAVDDKLSESLTSAQCTSFVRHCVALVNVTQAWPLLISLNYLIS